MGSQTPCVSRALPRRSVAARTAAFAAYTLSHARLAEARAAVLRALAQPRDTAAPVILVIGPAGVGKTTLLQAVARDLTWQWRHALAADPGRLACVSLVTDVPATGSFNWKDYCTSALQALQEPLLTRKTAPALTPGWAPHGSVDPRSPEAVLRRSLIQAAQHRAPAAFLIDEAQHLAMISSGRKLQQQMDYIKRLADATAVPHVLVGNYGLCLLRNLNGQLGRRTTDVHLRRYDATRPQDVADFRDVVLSFQGRLPLAEPPNLVDDWEHLYVRSVGCVGLLKAWLTRALGRALECGESTLRPADLRRAAPPPSKSQVVLQEALEGERLLAELDPAADLRAAEATLRGLLGLDTRSGPGGHPAPADGPAPVSMRSRRRVGQRRPTRDPVRPDAGRERLG